MSDNENKPHWLGSKEGISDDVLEPWTPVELETAGEQALTVRVWGREYCFGAGPFLDAVQTARASVLAAPIKLIAEADGGQLQWQADAPDVTMQTPAKVAFAQEHRAGGLHLSVRTEVEYDGMVRADWELTAEQAVKLQRLSFEIRLREAHARYLYHYPGTDFGAEPSAWGPAYNAGALPEEGFVGGFRPFIWLGDEERGLSWFTETDENWFPGDSERVTEIVREDGLVILRLHLVDEPLQIGPDSREKLAYTFGFQATPVKPVVADVWDYRICHKGNYGIEEVPPDAPATLTYQSEGNINPDQGTLEFWVRPLFDTESPGADQPIITVAPANGEELALCWRADGDGLHLDLQQGDGLALQVEVGVPWQSGEFHHLALSWGEAVCLYADGQPVAEQSHAGLLSGNLADGQIVFGGPGGHLVVDEIRISDIARSDAEIATAATGETGPQADEHTLLLDHLDSSTGGMPKTQPARGEGQGIIGLRHACSYSRFVEGKFGNGLQLGLDRPIIDDLADLGVRTVCFHEQWTDIESYTRTTYGEQLHSLVEGCHKRGMKLLIYFGFLLSNLAPEWDEWADECLVGPRRGYEDYNYPPQPRQQVYLVCYNSAWQDFLAQGIAELMDEYDVDGVYLDGTANPHECSNLEHGCGYIRDDGTAASTFPIFAVREMMRRIYTIVKSRKPDGQVNVHQSTCMTIPTLSWATSYWDGEQFGSIEAGPFALETLPLDAFRTEFMGHQWGVPAEFLCYDRPYTYDQACAFTLVHDVLVRGKGPHLELEAQLWRLADEFGREDAEWMPYWRNDEYVSADPEGAVASLYRHEQNGVLAVVANLGREQENVAVKFNLAALEMSGEATATDALTKESVAMDAGEMDLQLASLGWQIVWLQEALK